MRSADPLRLAWLLLLLPLASRAWSLDLASFLDRALARSHSLASARLEVTQSEQHLLTERRRFWPSLEVNLLSGLTEGEPFLDYGNLNSEGRNRSYEFWGGEAVLSWPLFRSGTLIGGETPEESMARLSVERAREGYSLTLSQEVEDLVALYAEVPRLREELASREADLALQRLRWEKTRALFERGAASARERRLAELHLRKAELALREVEADLHQRLEAVRLLLGEEGRLSPGDFVLPRLAPPPKELAPLLARLEAANPEVRQSLLDVQIERKGYEASRGALWPEVRLEGGARYYEDLDAESRDEVFLLLRCQWSFGFDRLSEAREHLVSERKAREAHLSLTEEKRREVIESFFSLRSLWHELAEARIELEMEELELAEREERFRLGEITEEDLLAQRLTLRKKRASLASLQADYLVESVHLKHLVGLSWDDPWPEDESR